MYNFLMSCVGMIRTAVGSMRNQATEHGREFNPDTNGTNRIVLANSGMGKITGGGEANGARQTL